MSAPAKNRSKTGGKFAKGQSGNPNGRKTGTPNKTTKACKEALSLAFDGIGGVPALIEWAKGDPGEFYKLWAKLLPMEVKADVDNKHSGTIAFTWLPPEG